MSRKYIKNNFENIKKFENIIEKRLHSDYNIEYALKENEKFLEMAEKYNVNYILIDDKYSGFENI